MKHLYFFFLSSCLLSNAQIVNFPDPDFKNYLISTNCASLTELGQDIDVDLNDDGEVQVSEAQAIIRLTLPGIAVNSIEGIQAFENLYYLRGAVANNPTNITLIQNMSTLGRLSLGGSNLTHFDFSQLTELTSFNAGYNPFVVLDLSPTKVQYLDIQFCPTLEYLNTKNGYFTECQYGPDDGCWDWWPLEDTLHALCKDDIDFVQGSYSPLPWGVANSYCSFAPGGDYNTVSGSVTFDCGPAAVPATFISMNVTESTSGTNIFSDHQGNYLYYMNIGNVVITPDFQNPYYTVTPSSINHNFTGTNEALDIDFCISPNGSHSDVEVSIIPTNAARPGFNASYRIELYNKGTLPMSGTVSLNFDGDLIDYVASNPAGTSQTGTVSWAYSNIAPLTKVAYSLTLNVNSPMETTPVNIGDILSFTAIVVTETTDEAPQDNTAMLHQTVVGSFDPNDKLVAEGSQIAVSQINDYLHYTIRFQNTGTAEAINVVIDDFLKPSLDSTTVEIISSSHPMYVTREGNKLQFFHEGINLPASSVDEPGSHGFVSYKVKPATSIGLGSVIENSAKIYFDYNFPINTNTVTTTVVQQLSISDYDRFRLRLYPNPASESFTVSAIEQIQSLKIYNLLGQLIETVSMPATNQQVSIRHLQSGTYIIAISTQTGTAIAKLVKS